MAERFGEADVDAPRRPLRVFWSVAWRDLVVTERVETATTVLSVAWSAAVAGLAILSLGSAAGQLRPTLLDFSVRQRFEGLELVLAVVLSISLVLTAAYIAATIFINRLSRYATLRAMGWPRLRLIALLLMQAVAVAAMAGAVGAGIVISAAWLGHSDDAIQPALAAVLACAALSVGPLVAAPTWLIYRRTVAELMAGH
jgi:hypothetical protein